MGITPGGATPASFMSYGMARRMSKDPQAFGKGEIEGVVAPETAAHAAGTSALLPMLTLGIPGSPTAAVLLGGLLIWGLQPGPMLFVEQKDFVWGLIAIDVPRQHRRPDRRADHRAVVGGDPAHPVLGHRAGDHRHLRDRRLHRAQLDVRRGDDAGVRRASATCSRSCKYPLAPLVLALVLGDMAEASFRQAMLLSQGSLAIFWSNPLVGSIAGAGAA